MKRRSDTPHLTCARNSVIISFVDHRAFSVVYLSLGETRFFIGLFSGEEYIYELYIFFFICEVVRDNAGSDAHSEAEIRHLFCFVE